MSRLVYSHRLKTLLQQTVVDLGVSLTLNDRGADVSLRDHEKVLEEAAAMLKLRAEAQDFGDYYEVTFSRR